MGISQAVRTAVYQAISNITVMQKAYLENANIVLPNGYSLANSQGDVIVVSGIFQQGQSAIIPVFDGVVNPNVTIPVIEKASVYIIINDQQADLSPLQNMCNERITASLTIKIVSKYKTANVTDRTLVEAISEQVQKAIRPTRYHALESVNVNIQDVGYPITRDMDEFAAGQTAFSKILIYSITVNQ
ncbi:hypothetical protein [Sphingobacterium griseoflavum]|uniref:Baseplate protein J-like domain-containing protein n=1 Tax=Sphingobacterium griseoflavum TaxID=1474952 RepID=A0ABQ3HZH7_9SPHI|nr:hypothetical protein [Sphingobacterium griseoflavum]GHE34894.1 hypothetical protein GCM10017764_17610 [Sphingobacterium griseoflavum]